MMIGSKIAIIEKTKLFYDFSKEDIKIVCSDLKPILKKYSKGEFVMQEGNRMNQMFIIVEGVVRGEKYFPNGETHLLEIYDEQDVIGIDVVTTPSKISPANFIASTSAKLLMLDINKIQSSNLSQKLYVNLTGILADENIKKRNKIEVLSCKGLREKILTYFFILQKKAKSNNFQVKMTQNELAQYLCVNRSALSNELNLMRKEGIIDFKKEKFTLKIKEEVE